MCLAGGWSDPSPKLGRTPFWLKPKMPDSFERIYRLASFPTPFGFGLVGWPALGSATVLSVDSIQIRSDQSWPEFCDCFQEGRRPSSSFRGLPPRYISTIIRSMLPLFSSCLQRVWLQQEKQGARIA